MTAKKKFIHRTPVDRSKGGAKVQLTVWVDVVKLARAKGLAAAGGTTLAVIVEEALATRIGP